MFVPVLFKTLLHCVSQQFRAAEITGEISSYVLNTHGKVILSYCITSIIWTVVEITIQLATKHRWYAFSYESFENLSSAESRPMLRSLVTFLKTFDTTLPGIYRDVVKHAH